MSGAPARMALIVLSLLVVLTYLLLRGLTPDAALQERRLHAIDALGFNEAALQRDVLKASQGLLPNYDPLVATVARLHEVAADLRQAGAPAPLIDGIAAELDRQEGLVEDFKSAHALLRNSVAYFTYLSQQLILPASEAEQALAMSVGRLASAMFVFVGSASNDAAADVAAALDELSVQPVPDERREDTDALRAHSVLILKNQPLVDGILARGDLSDYRLAHAARADLCRRLGRTVEARASYERALELTRQEPERRFLERRLAELARSR